ncbi:hypothetical protein ACJRO7_005247 [Eucalyptus globulus]|uniref:Uncharacterized protein n=1 Tax=Eucalyptus globulus TaxID=34317 RepID=A0ABD3J2B3_EUCGL
MQVQQMARFINTDMTMVSEGHWSAEVGEGGEAEVGLRWKDAEASDGGKGGAEAVGDRWQEVIGWREREERRHDIGGAGRARRSFAALDFWPEWIKWR